MPIAVSNPGAVDIPDGQTRELFVDRRGRLITDRGVQSYTLLSNATATGQAVPNIQGGDYVWRIEGTFGGATATLQMLGLDGTTWLNVRNAANTADVTATANSSIGVGIGQGATVRVALSGGTPSAMNSTLAGL